MTTATGDHKLSFGPRAGSSVRALAASDEGRGHLRWITMRHDAPPEDRAAARAALAVPRSSALAADLFPKRVTPPLGQHHRRRLWRSASS